jgi:hypothetical protein
MSLVSFKNVSLQKILTSNGYRPSVVHYKYDLKHFFTTRLNTAFFKIRKLDINSTNDINFTYEILKQRYEKNDIININDTALPSLETHKQNLQNKYKYFYICEYNKKDVAIVYIIQKNNELGYFVNYKTLKNTLKHIKQTRNVTKHDLSRGGIIYISQFFLRQLLRKHPLLIFTLRSRVKAENEDSHTLTIKSGLKPSYIEYEVNTTK